MDLIEGRSTFWLKDEKRKNDGKFFFIAAEEHYAKILNFPAEDLTRVERPIFHFFLNARQVRLGWCSLRVAAPSPRQRKNGESEESNLAAILPCACVFYI